MFGLTGANLRHLLRMFRFGTRPAVTVYESLGTDFFLAPAPGWLNLGWWEGEGSEEEAPRAPERLVEILADPLPPGGAILDVANGLGAQDPVIARVAAPGASLVLSVPREPIFRTCNLLAGRYVRDLGNTPGHLNHWSTRSFVRFVGTVARVRLVATPFPWTVVWATLDA